MISMCNNRLFMPLYTSAHYYNNLHIINECVNDKGIDRDYKKENQNKY